MASTLPDQHDPNDPDPRRSILALLLDFLRPTIGEASWTPWVRAVLSLVVVAVLVLGWVVIIHTLIV